MEMGDPADCWDASRVISFTANLTVEVGSEDNLPTVVCRRDGPPKDR